MKIQWATGIDSFFSLTYGSFGQLGGQIRVKEYSSIISVDINELWVVLMTVKLVQGQGHRDMDTQIGDAETGSLL